MYRLRGEAKGITLVFRNRTNTTRLMRAESLFFLVHSSCFWRINQRNRTTLLRTCSSTRIFDFLLSPLFLFLERNQQEYCTTVSPFCFCSVTTASFLLFLFFATLLTRGIKNKSKTENRYRYKNNRLLLSYIKQTNVKKT